MFVLQKHQGRSMLNASSWMYSTLNQDTCVWSAITTDSLSPLENNRGLLKMVQPITDLTYSLDAFLQ